jgi:hypothetical protein
VVDAPTELPEGSEVKLWVVEGDDLDDTEREALHQAIHDGFSDATAGHTDDAAAWAAELRSRS